DGMTVGLLAASKKKKAKTMLPWYTAINLQGQVTTEPIQLHEAKEKPQARDAGRYLLWIIILAMALAMIFIFWRRDLRNQQVKLPGNLALAGLGRRSVAGFIDLVPVLVIVSSIFHIGPAELFAKHWPGEGSVQSLQTMAPGL